MKVGCATFAFLNGEKKSKYLVVVETRDSKIRNCRVIFYSSLALTDKIFQKDLNNKSQIFMSGIQMET